MQRASRRKYHFIYKTVCLETGRFYIGMHSTDDIDDGYLGSGKRLLRSVEKYGPEAHRREIVQFCDTREQLRLLEEQVVNEDLLNDAACMNLTVGGDGGWHSQNADSEVQKRKNVLSQMAQFFLRDDPDWVARKSRKISESNLSRYALGEKAFGGNQGNAFKGRSHSIESRIAIGQKNSISQRGAQNSQAGTAWVTNGTETRKVQLDELTMFFEHGYRRGRK